MININLKISWLLKDPPQETVNKLKVNLLTPVKVQDQTKNEDKNRKF